jgi:AcrR family transcriptional regulator
MSPRPRTINDSDIFAATLAAAGEFGPTKLTLAHVAKKVGMSPATLIQRFGTKRGLLLAALGHGAGSAGDPFRAARERHASLLEALLAVLTECSSFFAVSPEVLANHLAFLQMDLTDPDFYALTLRQAQDTHEGIRTLLEEAVAAKELVAGDTERLARAVHDVYTGAVLNWAVFRDGSVEDRVLQGLATLLSPLRAIQRR